MAKFLLIASLMVGMGCAHRSVDSGDRSPAAFVGAIGYGPAIPLSEIDRLLKADFSRSTPDGDLKLRTLHQTPYGKELLERLQGIDKEMRKMMNVTNAPFPQFLISGTNRTGAFTLPVTYCLEVPATINGGQTGSTFGLLGISDIAVEKKTLAYGHFSGECINATDDVARVRQLDGLLAGPIFFGGDECRASRTERGIDFQCGAQEPLDTQKFLWRLQSPHIIMESSTLGKISNWNQFDAMISHELAHFYLLHGIRFQDFGYFYDRKKNKKPLAPEKAADLEALGNALQHIGVIDYGGGYKDYFHSTAMGNVLRKLMVSVASALENARLGNGNFAYDRDLCEKYGNWAKLQVPPFHQWDATEVVRDNFFSGMRACYQTIRYKENAGSYYSIFFQKGDSYLIDYFAPSAAAQPVDSLWDAFALLDVAVSHGITALKTNPDYRRLGQYSHESEADAYAVKYLLATKRSATDLQDLFIQIFEDAKVDFNKCLRGLGRNWKTIGRPVPPRLDNFSDQHHGICYRLYNVSLMEKQFGGAPARKRLRNVGDSFERIRRVYGGN